jgi:hypothetical protein
MHDPYTLGAAAMLGISPEEVTEQQRALFKKSFLLALYGAGEQQLLDSVYNDLEQMKREKYGNH